MVKERKTKQVMNTYSSDEETEDKLFMLSLKRSQDSGKTLSKSAVIRLLIQEAYELELV